MQIAHTQSQQTMVLRVSEGEKESEGIILFLTTANTKLSENVC